MLTPSGEVQTISFQSSRIGSARVAVPTLLQLGEDDQLFPVERTPEWEAQFVAAPSVTTDVVPGSAHTYMLHHPGPAAAGRIADWLGDTAGLAGCSPAAAAARPESAPPVGAGGPEEPLPATGAGSGGVGLVVAVGLAIATVRRRAR